jgi:molybdopterin-guanine dinucleotide biosynthesis protein A
MSAGAEGMTARARIAGVILAGGLATRMGGGDKTLLALGDRPILAQVIDRLRPQVDAVVLNANGDPARFAAFGLLVVADTVEGYAGPLAGILAGMDWAAAGGFDLVASAAGDTPFFPETLVADLRTAMEREGTPLAMAMTPDPERGLSRHPTFGLWSVALREDLRTALGAGQRKVIEWAEPRGCAKAVFEGAYPFFNVNTPEDLARAQALLAEQRE